VVSSWLLDLLLALVGIVGGGTVYYYLAAGRKLSALWAAFACAVLTLLWVALRIQNNILTKRAQAAVPVFNGVILPGSEITPWVAPTACSLMLGDELQVWTRSARQFVVTGRGKPFLSLKVVDGKLLISATIVDSTGQHVVRIIDNEFQASSERAFNPKQPDEHSLTVRDLDGAEVLNLRYLNPRVIRITGRFHLPGYDEPVKVLAHEGLVFPDGGGMNKFTLNMMDAPDGTAIAF